MNVFNSLAAMSLHFIVFTTLNISNYIPSDIHLLSDYWCFCVCYCYTSISLFRLITFHSLQVTVPKNSV